MNPCFIFLVRMLASGLPAAVKKCCPSSGGFQVVKGHRSPRGHEPMVSSGAEVLRRCSWVTSKGLPALLPGERWRWGASGTLGMGQTSSRGRDLRKINLLCKKTGECWARLWHEGVLSM